MSPAPPVGFNVTFVCPPNHVFDFDWFAIPFIMMTCQDDGTFDQPDWDLYSCVLGYKGWKGRVESQFVIDHIFESIF